MTLEKKSSPFFPVYSGKPAWLRKKVHVPRASGLGEKVADLLSIARNGGFAMAVLAAKEGRGVSHFVENEFIPALEAEGDVFVDREYSKAYLRHLFISKEILSAMIATIHNLGFYMWLMKEARKNIVEGNFAAWKNVMVKQLMQRL